MQKKCAYIYIIITGCTHEASTLIEKMECYQDPRNSLDSVTLTLQTRVIDDL